MEIESSSSEEESSSGESDPDMPEATKVEAKDDLEGGPEATELGQTPKDDLEGGAAVEEEAVCVGEAMEEQAVLVAAMDLDSSSEEESSTSSTDPVEAKDDLGGGPVENPLVDKLLSAALQRARDVPPFDGELEAEETEGAQNENKIKKTMEDEAKPASKQKRSETKTPRDEVSPKKLKKTKPSDYNVFMSQMVKDKSFCEGESHKIRFAKAIQAWNQQKPVVKRFGEKPKKGKMQVLLIEDDEPASAGPAAESSASAGPEAASSAAAAPGAASSASAGPEAASSASAAPGAASSASAGPEAASSASAAPGAAPSDYGCGKCRGSRSGCCQCNPYKLNKLLKKKALVKKEKKQ
jgi:hypothetical protein